MAGLNYLDPTAVNRQIDAYDQFGTKLEDAVVKRRLMRADPGEEPITGPDPSAVQVPTRDVSPPAPVAPVAAPTPVTAAPTPPPADAAPRAGLTTTSSLPTNVDPYSSGAQGQYLDPNNPDNAYVKSIGDLEQLKARVGALSNVTGRETRRNAATRFGIDGGAATAGTTVPASTIAETQQWFGSKFARDYFAAHPERVAEATADPVKFYQTWASTAYPPSEHPPMPAAAEIGAAGETPPDDHMAAIAYAVALEESGNDPSQKSKTSTANGAMQTLNGTVRNPGFGVKPAQDDSVAERDRVGRDLLTTFVSRYGDLPTALIAYNQGGTFADKVASGAPLTADEKAKLELGQRYASRVLARLADHETNGVGDVPRAGLSQVPAVAGVPLAPTPVPVATGTPAPTNMAAPDRAVSNNVGHTVPATNLQIPVGTAPVAAPAATATVTPTVATAAPPAQAYPTNTEVQQQLIERNRLKQLAGAYRAAGAGDRYFDTLRKMDAVDKQLVGFATNRALDNFESGGRPEYLSQVLSQASGQQVVLRPRSDGKFDEEIGGRRTAEGLTRQQLVNQYRYTASSTYAAGVRTAQITAQTKANDENFKRLTALELEALKGRVQLTVEEVKGMGKVTPGRDGAPTTVQLRNGQVAVINPTTVKGVDGVERQTYTLAPLGGSGGYSPSDYKVGP